MKYRLKLAAAGLFCGFGWCIGFLQLIGEIPQRGTPPAGDVLGMAGVTVMLVAVFFSEED